ncbi:MAG: N-acetylneuraminate synthase family protein [Cyclobacteriaceae bacterium]
MNSTIWEGKNGPLLIAEIGGNHEGNFEYAKKLTKLAIDSGADYVKFQIYSGDGLVNPIESPDRNKHFKKFELSEDQHKELAKMCRDNKVGYLASVWETGALDWIDQYMDFYKIGSGDLTAYPVIKSICALKKPILLSTGLATEAEVLEAVNYIRSLDSFYQTTGSIAILQCTAMYPIPYGDANLNVMEKLRVVSNCTIGYSDHTEGSFALEVAVAMGARILEFHFTDDRDGKEFRDHKVSLTKHEVEGLIKKINEIENLQGNDVKVPLEVEGDHVVSFRRAVYPAKEIPANTKVKEEDFTILRPDHGISANKFDLLLGKTTTKTLKKFEKLDWKYFE